jgi:type III restriction enzyme
MKDIKYQQEAIKELLNKIVKLLNINEERQKIVFKAPTGSGKTYMTAKALEAVVDTLQTDKRNQYERVAFVWIAPNRLHSQAYGSLSKLFEETRALNPIMFDDITDGVLNNGDVLCLNWGSIHSDDNILVKESETGFNLWEVIERTREEGTAIVAIIDEEHLHWDRTADKAATVLSKLKPIVELRVSATPKTVSPYTVTVSRKDVIAAQMIKESLVINPDIEVNETMEVEEYLIDEAIKKRDLLAQCYEEMGKKIKPLLLIQLPNDNATISAEDKSMRDEIVTFLESKYEISVNNGELAIWLADKDNKQNLEGIEKPDSDVKVLIFKEAIAKGWDCPRAAVLLIFRKLQSNEFAIQTLGRILRMPEQKYYFNPLLNKGYVYTNISKDRIIVAGETEDYWKQNVITACRRKNLHNITLPSVYEFYASADRNRLGSDFSRFLIDFIKKHWLQEQQTSFTFDVDEDGNMTMPGILPGMGEDINSNRQIVEQVLKIRFNVKGISITIPKDLNVDKEEEILNVKDSLEYTRSENKILTIFNDYCRSLLTSYERTSIPTLAGAIIDAMEFLFGINEWDARRIILSVKPNNNNAKFTDLFSRTLDAYYVVVTNRKAEAKERSFQTCLWTVPESREYNSDNNRIVDEVENHALEPYVRYNRASEQEKDFESFLEENTKYIDWWYKNGDEGRQHYAVEYLKKGKKALFYVDYIIRMKNGQIFLLDTKSAGPSGDPNEEVVVAKHNALIEYINNQKDSNLKGGIIKNDNGTWKYCPLTISNTTDLRGWTSFFPDQIV